jgi:hypothetical protein
MASIFNPLSILFGVKNENINRTQATKKTSEVGRFYLLYRFSLFLLCTIGLPRNIHAQSSHCFFGTGPSSTGNSGLVMDSLGVYYACPNQSITFATSLLDGNGGINLDQVKSTLDTISPNTSYTITNIPYKPYPFNGGTPVPWDTIIPLIEVRCSQLIDLGFPFCFFNQSYNQVRVGSNGFLSFPPANSCQTWSTNNGPFPNFMYPSPAIMFSFTDLFVEFPSVDSQIRYRTEGIAPCRRFILTFNNVSLFNCANLKLTAQLILFEGTRVIETHIQSKPVCTSWNNGRATHGLHRSSALSAVIVPGRNNSVWSVTAPEGKRFIPNGSLSCAPTTIWHQLMSDGTLQPLSTGTSYTFNITEDTTRLVVARVCSSANFCGSATGNFPFGADTITLVADSLLCSPQHTQGMHRNEFVLPTRLDKSQGFDLSAVPHLLGGDLFNTQGQWVARLYPGLNNWPNTQTASGLYTYCLRIGATQKMGKVVVE